MILDSTQPEKTPLSTLENLKHDTFNLTSI